MTNDFKVIPGFEKYLINTTGDVFSTHSNRILRTQIKKGYRTVNLSVQGKTITRAVHRLVAITFIANPQKLPAVNHKDENKLNNEVSNLEWCSVAYNNSYNGRIQRIARKHYKPVLQYDQQGNLIREYPSLGAVAEQGYSKKYVGKVCRHEKYSYRHKGFIFKYKEEVMLNDSI